MMLYGPNFDSREQLSPPQGLHREKRLETLVRPTVETDASVLKDMLHACITDLACRYYEPNPQKVREWLGLITEEGLIRGATDSRFSSFVVCKLGSSTPIGLGVFDLVAGKGLQNYVAPGYQGRGVGRTIASTLDTIAFDAGWRAYTGLATRAGLAFWKSLGHLQIGPPQLFLDYFEMFPVLRIPPATMEPAV